MFSYKIRTISFSGSEDFFKVLPDIWAVGVDVAEPTTYIGISQFLFTSFHLFQINLFYARYCLKVAVEFSLGITPLSPVRI